MKVAASNPPKENNSFKNNLIQNFYVIGFSPDDFFKIDKKEKKGTPMNIFVDNPEKELNIKPKLITKFPNTKMCINTIPDQIIVDHCFPNDKVEITKYKEKESFQFSLDNIPQNYEDDFKYLYSKIYFSCLIIKEPLINYFKYKKEIINSVLQNKSISISDTDRNQPLDINDEIKYSELYIPKIICFASVLPFYNELKLLLEYVYDYYLSRKNFANLPLEKVIEKIIIKIPIPINSGEDLIINFDTNNFKQKIVFPQNILSEIGIQYYANISFVPIFQYFSVDDVIRIFKYILFEIPILFFSDDKSICSLFVNIFLTLLTPFKYVFPHISILPRKLYGLIGTEKNFIFGINELYQESFFETNNIELTKNIIIISVDFNKNPPAKIEEKIYVNNKEKIYIITDNISKTKEDAININGVITPILSVDIPYIFKKKLSDGINKYLSFMKKKFMFSKKEPIPTDFTFKIQKVFYKFFVEILEGYTDFFLKSQYLYNDTFTKNVNIGENLLIKYNDKFRLEVFNEEEFILKTQKEFLPFYKVFFSTEMFTYFLREKIYNIDPISQLAFKRFDLLTYLKKYKEMRKRPENKVLYDNFKNFNTELINIRKKYIIVIKEEDTFNKIDVEKYINNKETNMNLLLNYGQLFQVKENVKDINNKQNDFISKYIDINYLIFPKLNFLYISKNNYKQLNLMSDTYLIDYKNICNFYKCEYERIRPYAFYSSFFPRINKTNVSCVNYAVHSKNYIYYIWLMLLSASLHYCEKEERNCRLDKMFTLLNNYEYIEEYVLNFIFINLYKSANTFYLVKFFLLYYKIVGYANYYLLNLFCDKIQNNSESEKIEQESNTNNSINPGTKRDLVFSKRYLINPEYNFDEELKNDSNENEAIDELIFCSEQECPKCHKVININCKLLAENHTSLKVENHKYQCLTCNLLNDIYIKYQILKFNYITQEIFLIEKGNFKLLTPFKLYQDLKAYFIKENSVQLDINNIFTIGNKFNFMNIIFNFSVLNIAYDFLFPYEKKLLTSIKLLFGNYKPESNKKDLNNNKTNTNTNTNNNKIKEKVGNKPIKLNFENNKQNKFRQFYNIQPLLNPQKINSKILGFINKEKYVYNDLSFTIKNSKKHNKKKK